MADTRDYQILGVWAAGAQTTIPADPVTGVAYRDETVDPTEFEEGWPYNLLVESSDYNQKLFLITSVLLELDQQGVLGWNDTVDYGVRALARGSDSELYTSILANGPTTAVVDPVGDLTGTWELLQDYVGGGGGVGTNMVQQVYAEGVDYTAGVTTGLTLPADPGGNLANVFVYFEGNTLTTDFTVLGTTITFTNPIPVGVGTVVIKVGSTTVPVVDIDTYPDGTAVALELTDRFLWSDQSDGQLEKFGNFQQIQDLLGGAPDTFIIQDFITAGGTRANDPAGWQTRILNTVDINEIAGASLGGNQITLPAGTYQITGVASCGPRDFRQIRLYNDTAASTLLLSSISDNRQNSTQNDSNNSVSLFIEGRITLGALSNLELQHFASAINSYGDDPSAVATGEGAVYSSIKIERLA